MSVSREGLFYPYQIQTPFDKEGILSSLVRIRPLMKFHLHIFETKEEVETFEKTPGNNEKKFLETGGSIWQISTTKDEIIHISNIPEIYLQPGIKEICDTFHSLYLSNSFNLKLPFHHITDFVEGFATGFFISKEGHILTNYHVARECIDRLGRTNGSFIEEDAIDLELEIPIIINNSSYPVYRKVKNVKIVSNVSSQEWKDGCDFSVLKIPMKNTSFLEIANEDEILTDATNNVWMFGFPVRTRRSSENLVRYKYSDANNDLRVSSGEITSQYKNKSDLFSQNTFTSNLDGLWGNSGSPILSSKGKVIGIAHDASDGQNSVRATKYFGEMICSNIFKAKKFFNFKLDI
ncbi:MAG: trypsin-like peptidase domain-containing protein [Oligoflexia bacterium]|nr:trypsin-like peptidase domain-containing protein [Oligoflexia bacterium]